MTRLKQKRCQAGHAKRGGGWTLFFRLRRDGKHYRRCLNKGTVNAKNEDYEAAPDPAVISLCAECNRTALGA